MNETFDIEDELENSKEINEDLNLSKPKPASSSSPKRKRTSISSERENEGEAQAKVSLFDSSGMAKNDDELEFLENELIPDDLMLGGDEAIVDTSSNSFNNAGHAQQMNHSGQQAELVKSNQISLSSTLAVPINDVEVGFLKIY